ncbi:hypothetical protein K0M31_018563 [Melipona bicolor]|uniref:Uncharacterized protein n=1 Tax=Melipona bicolor TaxID=60889 RepID=A0AA40KS16_9HYME|nr:hypothetical protein K0M31_018563 [Melipona bicolor]
MSEMCVVLFIHVNNLYGGKLRRTCSKAQNGSFKLCEGARSVEETTAKPTYMYSNEKRFSLNDPDRALIATFTMLEKNSRQKFVDKWYYGLQLPARSLDLNIIENCGELENCRELFTPVINNLTQSRRSGNATSRGGIESYGKSYTKEWRCSGLGFLNYEFRTLTTPSPFVLPASIITLNPSRGNSLQTVSI